MELVEERKIRKKGKWKQRKMDTQRERVKARGKAWLRRALLL
jgi:hypothetical protein